VWYVCCGFSTNCMKIRKIRILLSPEKCRPEIVVSGIIRFGWLFAEVHWKGGTSIHIRTTLSALDYYFLGVEIYVIFMYVL